jgi:flagellar export protein FliJ
LGTFVRKKFAFALQAVFEHRQSLEDAARRAVAVRRRAYDEAAQEAECLREEIRRRESEMRHEAAAAPARDLQLHDAHVGFLNRALEMKFGSLVEIAAGIEAARQAAIAASRQRKAIETLRDLQMTAFLAAEMHAEQTELDDANVLRRSSSLRSVRLG